MVKHCGELPDYMSSYGLLGSGKIISLVTTVNESGASPKAMSGFASDKFGDPVGTSILPEFNDASPTDETYCSNFAAEEHSHLVTEDHCTDTTTDKGLLVRST